jgi:hypothetical protein
MRHPKTNRVPLDDLMVTSDHQDQPPGPATPSSREPTTYSELARVPNAMGPQMAHLWSGKLRHD